MTPHLTTLEKADLLISFGKEVWVDIVLDRAILLYDYKGEFFCLVYNRQKMEVISVEPATEAHVNRYLSTIKIEELW